MCEVASESSSDPYLALLDWPTEGLDSYPAQHLFSRRTRTLLPMTTTLLKPAVPTDTLEKETRCKAKQALYFNVSAKELTELNTGDAVRVKPLHTSKRNTTWLRAQVQGKVDIQSYQVRTEDGQVYRRNRRYLFHTQDRITVNPRKSVLTDPLPLDTDTPWQQPSPTEQELPNTSDPNSANPPEEHVPCRTTRSSRITKSLAYLQDYET